MTNAFHAKQGKQTARRADETACAHKARKPLGSVVNGQIDDYFEM